MIRELTPKGVEMPGGSVELTADLAATFLHAANAMEKEGLRVLAFAWRELPESRDLAHAEQKLILSGLIGLEDPPRWARSSSS